MRERLDFAAISAIILNNLKEKSLTRTQYFSKLFDAPLYGIPHTKDDKNHYTPPPTTLDDTDMRKIVRGSRGVPKWIRECYDSSMESIFFEDLEQGVGDILEFVFDINKLMDEMLHLLKNDTSLSKAKRDNLIQYNDCPATFIAKCIVGGFSRQSTTRKKNGQKSVPTKTFELRDYLLDCHYPSVNKVFVGRDKELLKINQLLQSEHCVFLQGIGGIGKSELAKQYGKQFKKDYSYVIFMRYGDNLFDTICNLAFVDDGSDDDKQEKFVRHYRFFKQLDESVLVILDNFDTLPEKEELFDEFTSLSFQLLVTTRNRIDNVCRYLVKEIKYISELAEIFYAYAPNSRNTPEVVFQIIKEVYHHTLTVEMSAKTMTATGLSAAQLYEELKRDRLLLSNKNYIKVHKDNKTRNDTIFNHMKTLLRLQQLKPEEIKRLQVYGKP